MSYLNANAAFIQGGSYGDVENSIGPFVAKVDPKTLKPVWFTQLVNTVRDRGVGLPGRHGDRERRLTSTSSRATASSRSTRRTGRRRDPSPADVGLHAEQLSDRRRPTYDTTLTENAVNTSYNGINALPDGTIVVKSLYRVAGCTLNGRPRSSTVPIRRTFPASNLISVDPKTMQIIDNITLPTLAGARPTITRYQGVDYVYLLENQSPTRSATR